MRTTRWRWPRHAALTSAITLACGTVMSAGTAQAASGPFTIRAGALDIVLNSTGTVTGLIDTANHHDYASPANHGPLIQLMVDGAKQAPTRLTFDPATATYTFAFGGEGVAVKVQERSKSGYATLDVTGVSAPSGVDVQTLLWGPIATSITQSVGETVGVVHDDTFAIGIHELNDKTVGGWPDEFDSQTFTDVSPEISNWPFGWFAAHQTPWGSFLQAYTYDYSKTRNRYVGWSDMNESNVPVPPLAGPDGQITGSEVALFGTTPGNVLPTLSGIETGENLPHPMIDGQWGKVSQGASQSWLVLSDLNTGNVAQASEYAREAGMKYVYSLPGVDGPWQSAGHYQFNDSFGGSDTGAASLAATAAGYGIGVGVHTLSNLVDTNDSYVTPNADPGLAAVGSAALTRPAAAGDSTVYVSGNAMFNGGQGSILRIGNELLTYSSVSQVSPTEWQVTVKRGAYGTTPAAYATGATTSRIQQYAYGMLTGGISEIPQIATRLSQVLDIPNMKALSFDGLEDGSLAGYGVMGTAKLVNGVYRGEGSVPDTVTEASNLLPNTWDAQGRVSWGEHSLNTDPDNLPISLQPYYQRNYMPAMMGWLGFGAGDALQSQEWQLSKMAAYNAGAGLETSVSTLNSAGDTNQIMDTWNQWESARNAGAFTTAQQNEMKDLNSYWHLVNTTPGKSWQLYNVQYPSALAASGNGAANTWSYTNTHAAQPLQFQLQASGGAVSKMAVTLNSSTVTYTANVPSGGYLVADGTGAATVYDSTWHNLGAASVTGSASYVAGSQSITATATGAAGSTANIRFMTVGSPETVTAPATITAPTAISPGAPVTITTTYTNTTNTAQKNVSTVIDAPTGWTAHAATPATHGSVAAGKSVSTTWTLTPPKNEASASFTVTAQTTYNGAAREDRVLTGFTVGSGSRASTPATP
ncbi:NEW3 domain-containing protein [Catenulispora pinisilvae]|uniref:NEW3 domain-containing protein n=1 Tax=Catenulispora pinisilvae TaxID=2705253 RepID=UPI00189166D9|nr:NEW3 domain-containing protein [Catenulispora pinisilvae]